LPSILKIIHTAVDTTDKLDDETMRRMHAFALALVGRVARR
jgi:hypothetical protein